MAKDERRDDETLLTSAQTSARYGGRSKMALWRWVRDPKLGFPQPLKINDRIFGGSASCVRGRLGGSAACWRKRFDLKKSRPEKAGTAVEVVHATSGNRAAAANIA
jgi:hypothetical protein